MQISKATSKKEMRKVEEKGYGDEIIDAGDIFCNYGIGWHLCKKACDKCRRLCVRGEIGRPVAYSICVWYVILFSGCICRICRSVRMEIRSCVDMDRNRKCNHRKSAGWVVLGRRTKVMTQHLNSKTMPDFFGERYGSKGAEDYGFSDRIHIPGAVYSFCIQWIVKIVWNGLTFLINIV